MTKTKKLWMLVNRRWNPVLDADSGPILHKGKKHVEALGVGLSGERAVEVTLTWETEDPKRRP